MTLNAIRLNDYGKVYKSYTIYIVLFAIFLISISISSVFICFYWYLKKQLKLLKQQFIKCNSIEYINDNFQKKAM